MSSLHKAYDLLSEREELRRRLSLSKYPRFPAPEHIFYSVQQSLAHRTSNRYSNILAYDRTAVRSDDTYLNANVVTDGRGGSWVAAQAPIPGSFYPFFRAIYTRGTRPKTCRDRSAILVQLTGWEDNGIPKADPYLPSLGKTLTFTSDSKTIKLTSLNQHRNPELCSTITKLNLGGDLTLWHYYYDAWPDHGVPSGKQVDALKLLLAEVNRQKNHLECEVWIHCSAGIGRTGSFIGLCSLLYSHGELELYSPLGPIPEEYDKVMQAVDRIRESRGMLVQGPDQLGLLYQISGIKCTV